MRAISCAEFRSLHVWLTESLGHMRDNIDVWSLRHDDVIHIG